MIKIRPILLTTFLIGLALLLGGCKLVMLEPKGMIAASEKSILINSSLLMLIVVVPVMILTFAFAWHYRAGNTKAKYTPNWSHSTLIEVICWSIPCVIIVILGIITWKSSHDLDPYKPLEISNKKHITIQAIALEWKWLFIYPEQNIASINEIQIPVGVPIRFLITAEGPMNSLQIPQLAGQIYAMAGMQTKLHLIADTAGTYQGISANFSGDGFSGMKFTVRAGSQDEFDQWVKTVKRSQNVLTTMTYNQLVKPSENNVVKYFSSANKDIFATVIMKSMMPMKEMANDSDPKLVASSKK